MLPKIIKLARNTMHPLTNEFGDNYSHIFEQQQFSSLLSLKINDVPLVQKESAIILDLEDSITKTVIVSITKRIEGKKRSLYISTFKERIDMRKHPCPLLLCFFVSVSLIKVFFQLKRYLVYEKDRSAS